MERVSIERQLYFEMLKLFSKQSFIECASTLSLMPRRFVSKIESHKEWRLPPAFAGMSGFVWARSTLKTMGAKQVDVFEVRTAADDYVGDLHIANFSDDERGISSALRSFE